MKEIEIIFTVNHLSGLQLQKNSVNKIFTLFSVLFLVYILVCWEMTQDPGDLVALRCWMEEILESLNLRSLTSSSLVLPWVWFLHCEKLSFQLLTVSPDVNRWAHLVDGVSISCCKSSNLMRQTGKTQTFIYNIYCTVRRQITLCSSQYWLYNLFAMYFQTLKILGNSWVYKYCNKLFQLTKLEDEGDDKLHFFLTQQFSFLQTYLQYSNSQPFDTWGFFFSSSF